MQKKSLLVALFCGALCLTGCLKNEESASVALVRGAKAEELKSLAALNNAKAAAEAVYAEAELTVAKAEAKLREANAALVLAQAETEKVRAELLKVRVALAEVKVDEERVKLLELEAKLEQTLAEVEAAVAKAEAEKQGWINLLNHAIAAAEAQAITDAQAILEAEQALEAAVLKMEKAQADSAKKAATRYFDALNDVQKLEKELIETKAMKALVEAGAIQVRDAIYEQIDKIDEKIAEKEALVKYLKKYQTMTPEEAEEALMDARTALNEAYNKYRDAVEVKDAADDALNGDTDKGITGIKNMTADFVAGNPGYQGKHQYKREFEELISVTWTRYVWAKEDGERGVRVLDEDGNQTDEFIPLWTSNPGYFAKTEVTKQRYPDLSVYSGTEEHTDDFVVLETTTNTPVKVYFDNANKVLDFLVAEAKAAAQEEIDKEEKVNIPARIEAWQKTIDENEDVLDLHTKYVNERKAAVKAAEDEYIAAFKASKQRQKDIDAAWLAFQEYMLVHHDADRMLYISQSDSAKAYNAAKDAKTTAQTNFNAAKAALTESEGALKTARENEAKAEGEYRTATAAGAAGVPPATAAAWATAQNNWNPKFDAEKATAYGADTQGKGQKWHSGTSPFEEAAIAQNNLLNAQDSLKKWQAVEYNAQMVLWRTAAGTAAYTTAQTNYNTAHGQVQVYELKVTRCTTDANNAESDYTLAKKNYDAAMGVTEKEKWNPDFMGFLKNAPGANESITFPSDIDTTGHIKKVNNKWTKAGVVAGDSQGALIDAVIAYRDNYARVNADTYGKPAVPTEQAKLAEATAKEAKAKKEYEDATKKLIAALKHVEDWTTINLSKEKISDYLDENALTLWGKYDDAKKAQKVDLDKAWNKVDSLYWHNPNKIGAVANPDYPNWTYETPGLWPNAEQAQFSWWRSSFYVDYEAKMLDKETAQYYYIQYALNGHRQAKDEDGELVWEEIDDYKIPVPSYDRTCYSLAYQIERYQSFIDGKDEYLAWFKKEVEDNLKDYLEDIEEVRTNLMYFEPLEASYLTWIKDMASAEKALNEAKKAEFDAKQVKKTAQAKYDAAEAVANEGMWVYDPDAELYMKIYKAATKPTAKVAGKWEDGFTWITISEAIEKIEGEVKSLSTGVSALFTIASIAQTEYDTAFDNQELTIAEIQHAYNELNGKDTLLPDGSIAELNFTKKVLEQVLKVGKVGLQIIVDAFDEEIAELSEKIDVNTAIANMYKAIMNGWLGIVDEADAEGETGPLDGEGDDEE